MAAEPLVPAIGGRCEEPPLKKRALAVHQQGSERVQSYGDTSTRWQCVNNVVANPTTWPPAAVEVLEAYMRNHVWKGVLK